ncbi:hypothetical protein [Epilithonimonas caeni]|uniref:hypothetical protein n=1 Tax=Epilithonimonas caeni TaxID=365343 RepID=UPI00048166F5|nr:hypothetical protein [Epilithonimonas caeni]
MAQLGYTWYPQDWWTSETFKRLKRFPMVRYTIRELFDLMYKEGAPVKMNREYLEDDFNIILTDQDYEKLLEFITITEDGLWWIDSIRKRLTKAESSRENGKNGGRPKGVKNSQKIEEKKTQKPSEKTQANNLKNPPLEIEIEREKKEKLNRKEIEVESGKKFPPETTRNILFSKPISINQWSMKNKVDENRIKECIIEFSEFKERTGENQKWQNEADLIKNFEFWLNSNAKEKKPENFTSKTFSNEPKEIFRNRK